MEHVSGAECASKASNAEKANKWVRAKKGMEERVAPYLHLDSWLFWTVVSSSYHITRPTLDSIIIHSEEKWDDFQLVLCPMPISWCLRGEIRIEYSGFDGNSSEMVARIRILIFTYGEREKTRFIILLTIDIAAHFLLILIKNDDFICLHGNQRVWFRNRKKWGTNKEKKNNRL